MAPHPQVFAMVLAGGEGKRLAPLTADCAKPAVPFGGNFVTPVPAQMRRGPRWYAGSSDAKPR
jgi:glucose-1-phosphate adenylyltransferase